jgi:DNA-binding response OmpR family regulator
VVKKILIVDDQPEIRELLAMTLRIGPYLILQAAGGPEAIELARRERPHVVLLDVMLSEGGMDGFEVCRRLKACSKTCDSFVIMLTGCDQDWEVAAGYAAGANDYMVKPFSPLELVKKVHQIVSY